MSTKSVKQVTFITLRSYEDFSSAQSNYEKIVLAYYLLQNTFQTDMG